MLLFCDTSALAKLYLEEPHSDDMRKLARDAEAVAVSRIAWAEYHSALARRAREVPEDTDALDQARRAFVAEWCRYVVLEVTQAVVERAGEYADAFALRAYDAVQLASADETARQSGLPTTFACFDQRLGRAASILGMSTAPQRR